MTLHDEARKWGVETHGPSIGRGLNESQHRPDLDIAHELLATLPDKFKAGHSLDWDGRDLWQAYALSHQVHWTVSGTFAECVLALAQRAREAP
jgi:hypothetical protein